MIWSLRLSVCMVICLYRWSSIFIYFALEIFLSLLFSLENTSKENRIFTTTSSLFFTVALLIQSNHILNSRVRTVLYCTVIIFVLLQIRSVQLQKTFRWWCGVSAQLSNQRSFFRNVLMLYSDGQDKLFRIFWNVLKIALRNASYCLKKSAEGLEGNDYWQTAINSSIKLWFYSIDLSVQL